MATLAEIYDWFMTGKKPTQAQFWASWGSFWNKGETIPQSAISNLSTVLNAKTENDQFNAHKGAADAHAVLFAQSKVYELGQMQVFKKKLPDEPGYLVEQQAGDYCIGFVYNDADEIEFISADFMGGDITKKINYDV